jgi:hypothetical protein
MRTFFQLILLTSLFACGKSGCNLRPASRPRSTDSTAARPPALSDSEEDLQPDPRIRTWERIYVVRGRVRRYFEREHHWPSSLEPVLFADDIVDYRKDAWDRALRFTVVGDGFELRSLGEDGVLSTGDDIVATTSEMPRRPQAKP